MIMFFIILIGPLFIKNLFCLLVDVIVICLLACLEKTNVSSNGWVDRRI